MKIFESNPHLSKCYQTSDGECFYEEGPANLHANSLKDKKVHELINPKIGSEEKTEDADDALETMTKAEIVALAKADFEEDLDVNLKKTELISKYKELAGANAAGAPTAPIMKTVTQEDLDMNPALVEQGMKLGDQMEIPATTTQGE